MSSEPSPPQPMYLQGDRLSLFAMLHAGAEPRRRTAVLLCPPFGWDDMCSYRIRGEWADDLARAGYTTLRVDLPGSGDSAGDPGEPGQVEAWTAAVSGAAGWLGDHAGEGARIAVVAIGLGGILAARAALEGAPLDDLVLWAVPLRGQRLMRELQSFAALKGGDGFVSEEDGLMVNGYRLSPETVADLEQLDLSQIAPSSPVFSRALLLGRDGLAPDKSLPGVLEEAGATVLLADGPGYGRMMVEPQDARAPVEVFERVRSWLQEGTSVPTTEGANGAAGQVGRRWRRPALSASGELHTELGGVALRERPMYFEGPTARLFGVLCEPLEGRRELTGLLLNAGPQRRTGPNRMWVETARRWAAMGVATFRLDAAGIGDSEGDGSDLARHTEFYRQGYVDQTRAALDLLAGLGLPERFVTLGLCGGAYWSVHSALQDERVGTVILLNPRTLAFDEWEHTRRRIRQLKELALMPATWRRMIRGELQLARHVETGLTIVGRAAQVPTMVRARMSAPEAEERSLGDAVEEMFDALRERDQRGLVLFTAGEILREELEPTEVLDHMERWPNLQLEVLEDAVNAHTLTPLGVQRRVHGLVDRAVQDELDRLPVR